MKRSTLIALLTAGLVILPSTISAQVSFFQTPTFFGGCNPPNGIYVADFNGDGKLDLVCSSGPVNLGNGDGTFRQVTGGPGGADAIGDFNGDGKPDILLLDQTHGTLQVFLGNGDGTFQSPINTASGASLSLLTAVDVNNDGKTDIIGFFNGAIIVYLSKGDGTFASGVSYSLGTSTMPAILNVEDFNGDNKIDISVGVPANSGAGSEIVLLGNGDGTFQAPITSTGLQFPGFAVTGDFNGDGKLDLVVDTGCLGGGVCGGSIYALFGNGDGTFQTPVLVFSGYGPLAVADFNHDGKLDLVLENTASTVQILLGNGDGTFSNYHSYALDFPNNLLSLPTYSAITTADFNGDGKVDIAAGSVLITPSGGTGTVILGNGDGTLQGIPFAVSPEDLVAVAIGDFDGNNTTDLAGVSANIAGATNVYVVSNDGHGNLSLIHTYPLPQVALSIVAADFNGDGKLDLVVEGYIDKVFTWAYSVLLGNGDGSFQPPVLYQQSVQSDQNPSPIVSADLNNDHKPDFVVGGVGTQSLAVVLGNGDGTFAPPVYYYDAGNGSSDTLLAADINGDGVVDLVVGIYTGGAAILYGNGNGTFQPAVFPASLNNFVPLFTADFNNDGKPDLASRDSIALNNGDGTFTVLSTVLNSVFGVADFNMDGRSDAFVETANGFGYQQTGIQLGNGDGTFGSIVNVPANGALRYALAADMNNDKKPDIVFLGPSGVGVLLNTSQPVPPDFSVSPASGTSTSQTINSGQTASFNLLLTPSGAFTGTVNLSCSVSPVVTLGPTCSLSTSSIQVTNGSAQPFAANLATTAPRTAVALPGYGLPPATTPRVWTYLLFGVGIIVAGTCMRLPRLFAQSAVLAFLFLAGCGGGSGGGQGQGSPGTPPGTYTATVTAASGSTNHNLALQVTVQ